MSFADLRDFLDELEAEGELVHVPVEVDANQEVAIIHNRVLRRGGPVLFFDNVKGSDCPLVTNLFGTPGRVEKVFGKHPSEFGEEAASLIDGLVPPSPGNLWKSRGSIRRLLQCRVRNRRRGPVLSNEYVPPRLTRLPCLKCWPEDGGAFFTLPLVRTTDPNTGKGNLGIYRLQRFDDTSTGMHWQIEKGGAFHFNAACEAGSPLPVSVILGGPPALTLAAIAPLPEGIDEYLLAALIMGRPLDVVFRKETGHRLPTSAEFVMEGSVSPGDTRREGPFGDHLGHYSHSVDFPVFRVDRLLARREPVFPATVVGKPPQEDFFIGCALQEASLPLLKLMRPGVLDLWAYPETGFHPLAVARVGERYPREALKHALGLLGEGQLSLTKVLVVVNGGVDVRDFKAVSRAVYRNLDPGDGLHLLAPTAQDTLDFTGPAMNSGSRLILLATERDEGPLRSGPPPVPPAAHEVHRDIIDMTDLGDAFLVAQVRQGGDATGVRTAMAEHPAARRFLFHVLVSEDVSLDDPMLLLWGWFTRFDPLADVHPARNEPDGNRVIMHFPIAIDATWKAGYRRPVEADPDIARKVDARWSELGIRLPESEQ